MSLLLGRRLALVVTGGVGLDKGRDPYNGISTRNMLSFFFFLGKHEDFPKREFCGNFVESVTNTKSVDLIKSDVTPYEDV